MWEIGSCSMIHIRDPEKQQAARFGPLSPASGSTENPLEVAKILGASASSSDSQSTQCKKMSGIQNRHNDVASA
jgi:hypothetical protein